MRGSFIHLWLFILHAAGSHIALQTDNGFNAGFLGGGKNSMAANMVPWSVTAMAGMPISFVRATSFLMALKPSRSE